MSHRLVHQVDKCYSQIPAILTSLQRSVHAVLLGKTQPPDWLTRGIPEKAKVDSTVIEELGIVTEAGRSTVASDGKFLYVHNSQGLHKIGTGFGNTMKVKTCHFG